MSTVLLALALLLFPHLVASPVREEPPKKCTGHGASKRVSLG